MKSRLPRWGAVLLLIGAVGLIAWLGQSVGARVGSALDQMAGAVAPGPAAAPAVAASGGPGPDEEEFVISKEVCGYDFPFDEGSPRALAAEREIEAQAALGLRRAAERLSAETDPRQRTLGLVLMRDLASREAMRRASDEELRRAPCPAGDWNCEAVRTNGTVVYKAQADAAARFCEQIEAHARASGDPMAWAQAAAGCPGERGRWLQEWSRAQPDNAAAWLRQVRRNDSAANVDALLHRAARATNFDEHDHITAQWMLVPELKALPPAAWMAAHSELVGAQAIHAHPQWQDVMQVCRAALPGSQRAADCLAIGIGLSDRATSLVSSRIGDALVRVIDPQKEGARREQAGSELMKDYSAAASEISKLGGSCAGVARWREQVPIIAVGGEAAMARALAPRGREIRTQQARDAARDAQRNPFAPGAAGAAPGAPRN